ncbi:MAG: pyruvate:ferredoxin (flavodoxin) oxidoreductase [Bacilli bacterium]|nr:pyruvate:ferredoxin (flavodoxin) oxidoreductase [Bacilli bacterium]
MKKTMLSVDGNTAAALGSYNYIEVAGIYPITPSSPMAENIDVYASQNRKNFFGSVVKVSEMQSEAGASGTVHGVLQAGGLAATYTASQGLLLMIPNIYKWVGELLPAVLHVSARSLATRSLSIFGDHQDIYAIRQTGIAMICSHSVQEIADLTNVAHLVAIDASYPVCHFFDGFRTSHEIQNVEFVDDNEWKKLLPMDKVEAFRARALNPHTHPVTRGGAENDDIYFQGREAQNKKVEEVIEVADKYFKEASRLTGRNYAPFTYYGDPNAERVIIAMGSVTETITEVIDDLRAKGEKVGLIKVHLYRPFSAKHLLAVLPKSAKQVAVLDRTKEAGASGEPLYEDVVAAFNANDVKVEVLGGRYGLSSKDTQPKDMKAVFDFLKADNRWNGFTVSINDDVTHLSIPVDDNYHVKGDYTSCLFYGLGSDGTVSANKSSIKIIGDATGQYAQAYFAYDSRKAGGVTRSHLRFGKSPIHSTYYVQNADFISCSLDTYLFKFDMLKNLKNGGTFLLNTDMDDATLVKMMPNRVKYQLATKGAKFYVIDANKIAAEIGMGRHTNTILQASFFYLNQDIMPYDDANHWMKKFAEKAYGKKGQDVVELNYKAIDAGTEGLREVKVDPAWKELEPKTERQLTGDDYFDNYVAVIGNLGGDDLPVSKFMEYELLDGTMRNNITFQERRSIADRVPLWHPEACIQCNQCAFVCPHATIRPILMDEKEYEAAPELAKDAVNAMGPGLQGLKYRIQVSPRNCVGCGLCVSECMANKTGKVALEMVEAKSQFAQEEAAAYLYKHVSYKADRLPAALQNSVKGVGFLMPYMEISGACAGCGETPYYRLVSQLFGKDMLVANATGCSSIYSGSTPLTPFCTDKDGQGIAWANSLFEDNAEFGYGMRVATNAKIKAIIEILSANKENVEPELAAKIDEYFENIKNRQAMRKIAPELVALVKASKNQEVKAVLAYERDIADKSVWIVGGDGWSYDIGYGGLDHVIANEEDVNILVLDTEVYSNTGGQSSKSSQTGSIAKFTASGKTTAKKNLALIAMSYGNVYVAQISLGANPIAAIKALKEAESYDGPSLVICYAPCANHGIKGGLANSMRQERLAVECGYFPIFRYDPRNEAEGKPALTLDMKDPDYSKFRDFVMTETRFSQLPRVNPANAEELLTKSENYAKARLERIKKFGL